MKDLEQALIKDLRSEDYRYAYDEQFANAKAATQIKVLRESHDPPLTQAQLAQMAGMKQSRISELEDVDYSAWTISTLRRLARALGVRIAFQFESWSDLLAEVESLSETSLRRPPFHLDPVFQVTEEEASGTLPSDRASLMGALEQGQERTAVAQFVGFSRLSEVGTLSAVPREEEQKASWR
jgi:transcriptional regulator with XRE-family HTH domain